MFENHRKSLIQHWERSELRLHFEWTKVHKKSQNWWKLENAKNSNETVLVIFKQRAYIFWGTISN